MKALKLLPACLLSLCLASTAALGQTNTVGVFTQSEEAYDGYTLMPITANGETYLIDNCGEKIHSWTSEYNAGMMAYLLPDGSLIRAGRTNNTNFPAGGAGGIIERFDWEGNLTWSYLISSSTECQHHDIAPMPNGNVLALVWKAYPGEDWIAQGRDPALTALEVWSLSIVEIEPQGLDGGEVVWEWKSIDHLIQDFDPTLPNFGDPSMHPSQLDVNYDAGGSDSDWLHTNSIIYNEELDQIMVSSRDFNELWVIDHSIPNDMTATAAGHLLYRWGNPEAYGRGTEEDRVFFGQHDAKWIDNGQVMVFSNGLERPEGQFSTVDIITPPLNADGTYSLSPEEPWGPLTIDWRFPDSLDAEFFSPITSGAQQLPNGNILITEGLRCDIREVNWDQEVVWRYVNPMGAFGATVQGEDPFLNGVFKAERYPASHPGLAGRDLTPQGLLEITDNPPACTLFPEPSCPGDLNGNYLIDVSDLLGMLSEFGCSSNCNDDLDGDGTIGIGDLLILLGGLGLPCPS